MISVLVAAVASYAWGAVWYMVMAKPWMEAVGLTEDTIDRKNPTPFILAFVCTVLVAGMMRHVWVMAPPGNALAGLVSGLGVGLFLITPWIVMNYGFAQRSARLMVIDGIYASVGCALIGLILSLFQ